jgi:hypothetical protein
MFILCKRQAYPKASFLGFVIRKSQNIVKSSPARNKSRVALVTNRRAYWKDFPLSLSIVPQVALCYCSYIYFCFSFLGHYSAQKFFVILHSPPPCTFVLHTPDTFNRLKDELFPPQTVAVPKFSFWILNVVTMALREGRYFCSIRNV